MCLPPPAVPPLWLLRRAQRGAVAAAGESKKLAIIPRFSGATIFVFLDQRVARPGLIPFGPTLQAGAGYLLRLRASNRASEIPREFCHLKNIKIIYKRLNFERY